MPVYEFMCDDCGIKFEKLFRQVTDDAAPCPECGEPARRLVSEVNHTFKHAESQTRGPLPPNTGTSDDWNYDKAIGRDAAEKWEGIEQRTAAKDAIVRGEAKEGRGITRDHLVPDSEGGYRVVTEPERNSINTRREAATKAREAIASTPGE